MNRNYQKELDRIIQKRGQKVPRVLLHACCGVCSGAVLEYLTQYFDVTVLWYNPNLYPQAEIDRRFKALVERIEKMGLADKVSVLAGSMRITTGASRAWSRSRRAAQDARSASA